MKTKIFTVLAIAVFMASIMVMGTAEASVKEYTYRVISPQTALNMYKGIADTYDYVDDTGSPGTFDWSGTADIVDVRTLEEYYFVGTCALEGKGNPIAYNIPWELWTSKIECDTGDPFMKPVKCLFTWLIKKTFDPDDTIILMCRSGSRSTTAAKYLEDLGYFKTIIYDMDKGFQGSNTSLGYRCGEESGDKCWQGVDADLKTEGIQHLPMTQKLDPCKIWNYMFSKCK